jgi:hypothetical protein
VDAGVIEGMNEATIEAIRKQNEKKHDVQYEDGETSAKIDLPKMAVKTGEEHLDCIYIQKAKLYRYRDDQWKERGVGKCKLKRDNNTNKITLIMR